MNGEQTPPDDANATPVPPSNVESSIATEAVEPESKGSGLIDSLLKAREAEYKVEDEAIAKFREVIASAKKLGKDLFPKLPIIKPKEEDSHRSPDSHELREGTLEGPDGLAIFYSGSKYFDDAAIGEIYMDRMSFIDPDDPRIKVEIYPYRNRGSDEYIKLLTLQPRGRDSEWMEISKVSLEGSRNPARASELHAYMNEFVPFERDVLDAAQEGLSRYGSIADNLAPKEPGAPESPTPPGEPAPPTPTPAGSVV